MLTFAKAISVAALALTMIIGAAAQEPRVAEVNFGIISTESSTTLKKRWEPFLAAMAKGTGLKVNAFYAADYAGVIEAMRFNKVQVAWLGNKSAIDAVDRAKGEVFAQVVDVDGNPGYWSHLIVHKDSPIKSISDVLKCDKTVNFSIGDPNSTSGFLVPTTYIFAAKNVDPKSCFKTVRNASHEANAMAVAHKMVDVATSNSEYLAKLERTFPDIRQNVRVVWTSPLIPSDPIVWRTDLDPDVRARLYTWLMTYGRNGNIQEISEARKLLRELNWAPFRPSSNAQLYPIRELALQKELLKVKADIRLSETEKKIKIEELLKQIEKYSREARENPNL